MLRIVKSFLTIAIVAAIAVGATGAYFTDQEVVANNTFTAGRVDIDIRGACSTPQTFTGMAPGVWTAPCEYQIYNLAHSLPVKYMFEASKVSQTELDMYDLMNVIVRHTFAGTPDPSSWPIVYQGPLNGMSINSIDDAIADTLGTNITHVYYLQFQLDPSAGNEYQGDSVVFDLIFDATQADNPDWTE